MNKTVIRLVVYSATIALMALVIYKPSILVSAYQRIKGRRTVAEVVAKYGPSAENRLLPYFKELETAYPPEKIAFVALKEEKELELWASDSGSWKRIRIYKIFGASGNAGPKLKQGDHQVPEGLYRIVGLNPNSSYHLSMKLDYPNRFDMEQAKEDGRDDLGGDIFIHGSMGSVGCLAMGDETIEELFILVEKVGRTNTQVIIAPNDFRETKWEVVNGSPTWLPLLYSNIDSALKDLGAD